LLVLAAVAGMCGQQTAIASVISAPQHWNDAGDVGGSLGETGVVEDISLWGPKINYGWGNPAQTQQFVSSETPDVGPDSPVPEPAAIFIWSALGAGCLGMRVWRRRGGPVARQPWSDENRAAILEIIGKR
jgi:hypothetical protein